jgi:hypothetical protein
MKNCNLAFLHRSPTRQLCMFLRKIILVCYQQFEIMDIKKQLELKREIECSVELLNNQIKLAEKSGIDININVIPLSSYVSTNENCSTKIFVKYSIVL